MKQAAVHRFDSVNRYWDPRRGQVVAKILPGEFYVTSGPELISTVLGSCVAACVRDPIAGIGGMNHFLLPHVSSPEHAPDDAANRFGLFAMENLVNVILQQGGQRERLEVKLFGGAQVLNACTHIGQRNADFALDYVRREGLRLLANDLGGEQPRKLLFSPREGRVWMRRLERLHNDTLIRREENYQHQVEMEDSGGEIDLF